MTRAAKITYSVAILLGLMAGATLGYSMGTNALAYYDFVSTLMAPAAPGNFAYLQYKHADAEHARAALTMFAKYMEDCEKINPSISQERELSFAYVRLALVEESAKNPEQAAVFMAKGRAWYAASSKGKEPSDSQLRQAEQILEENGLH